VKYRAVIFDLDGTLLDSIDDLADCMNAALAACGLPTHPDVAAHKYFVGDGVRNYVLRVLPERLRGDDKAIAQLTRIYRANYSQGWKNKTKPYDGIIDLLDELKRRGVRSAVLSNKPDDTTRATTAEFLGAERFDVVQGALSDLPLKPDPGMALEIARKMKLPPAGFAYVGDTATDMATAGNAGMFAVGALWGFRTREELVGGGAKALAATPMDVLTYI
jgi:phosphoglycolate phosphatase